MTAAHDEAEWISGYRDGLGVALTVLRTVADDNGTPAEAAQLLEVLADSDVVKPDEPSEIRIQVLDMHAGRLRRLHPPEPPAAT